MKPLHFVLLVVVSLGLVACGGRKAGKDPAAVGEVEDLLPTAGQYGMLTLGYDGRKAVSGYYEHYLTASGNGCVFYLKGEAGQNPIPISIHLPGMDGALTGSMLLKRESVVIRLNDLPGDFCDQNFLSSGLELFITKKQPWQAVRIVKEKTFLCDKQDESTKTAKFLVQLNPVSIIDNQGEWVRVEYQAPDTVYAGWIQSKDLYLIE
jgi:hypothetical protein